MANKRITDVDYIDSLNSNESFFVNQNNTIRQINKGDVVFEVVNGGTGANNVADARSNLGLGSVAVENTVPITKGGTGAANAATALSNLGGYSNQGGLINGNVTFKNGKGLYGTDTNGDEHSLIFLSTSNTLQIGFNMPDEYSVKINNPIVLTANSYGSTFPSSPVAGQIFFLKST